MKKLCELLSFEMPDQFKDLEVSAIYDNSKEVTSESLFAALKGTSFDGRTYINDAISRGAKYILLDSRNETNYVEDKNKIIYLFAINARSELAHIASKFFPSKFDRTIAVTGTNGKSSTVDIVRQILNTEKLNAASIGTIGIITDTKPLPNDIFFGKDCGNANKHCTALRIHEDARLEFDNVDFSKKSLGSSFVNSTERLCGNMTSPSAIELHKIFNMLNLNGIRNVAIEASSHGIHQQRVDCINFDVCAFTNISLDHLDYHKTFENYWNAKKRLFTEIATEHTVFIANSDDPYSEKIQKIAEEREIRCLSYGYNSKDIKIINVKPTERRQFVEISFFGKKFSFSLPLQGLFQVYNSLCAAAICYITNIKIEGIISALENLHPISGRLELIAKTKNSSIYLDYAHSPDALKNAILSLRKIAERRIILVFGCGGNRDQEKRSIMGKIAEKFSDIVIITDDNPREEDPSVIRKMIMQGCANAIEIADRKSAIEFAIDSLTDRDILLIAGKGHENYQQIGKDFVYFSDKEIVLNKVNTI